MKACLCCHHEHPTGIVCGETTGRDLKGRVTNICMCDR